MHETEMTDEQAQLKAAQVAQLIQDTAEKVMKNGTDVKPDEDKGPACDFCSRHQKELKAHESMVAANKGSIICTGCASAIAGCMGATSDAEARRRMALMAFQAEAVVQSMAFMRLAGEVIKKFPQAGVIEEAATLAGTAETFARIALGD